MVDGVESGRKIKEAKTRQVQLMVDQLIADYVIGVLKCVEEQ